MFLGNMLFFIIVIEAEHCWIDEGIYLSTVFLCGATSTSCSVNETTDTTHLK